LWPGLEWSEALFHLPWGPAFTPGHLAALVVIAVLTAVNAWRTQIGAAILLIGLAGVALWLGRSPLDSGAVRSVEAAAHSAPLSVVSALVLAYLPVYFAYSGWNAAIYVAGEVRRPSRNIPMGLVGGTLVVTALYLLICLALLAVLGLGDLRAVPEAGSAAAEVLGGPAAQTLVVSLIAVAVLGTLNSNTLTGARVAYAMAKDGAFWMGAAKLSHSGAVPARALWVQAVWSGCLVLTESFEQILSFTSVAMVVSGSLTVLSLFVLRHRRPDLPRPYRATGYPWLPGLYLLSSAVVLFVMLERALSGEPRSAYPLGGIGIFVGAFLVHRFLIGPRRRRPV
jgi:APA family basic amino acid/polyamine antiporter